MTIYPGRLEWRVDRGVSGAKVTAGIMTGGLSMLATGVKHGKAGTEMIPVKAITSVTTAREGMLNWKVSVITAGNTIDFRVSHKEAEIVKSTLTSLILGTHPSLASAAAAPAAGGDTAAQLQQLASLRDAGVLTEAEFAAKKAEILARL
ncbi:SHOCT domain-containing protein [Propionibacterium cyclohexanicum]|uniref:SHOCT domain-containing protein n=1 Tax=Propionibacterium cyclohexanicum TaxID=64702 RepID=UPI001FDF273B|nr:SHOCT domain-containing protein [Propionibacterium cyclohexanicum]